MSRAERITEGSHALAAALVRPVTLASSRLLPVSPELATLLPEGGLRRGTILSVTSAGSDSKAPGVTSLALALLAASSAAGSWCAVVTVPDLGLVAAAEAGLDMTRVALLPDVAPAQWTLTVGALVDAVDVVVVGPPAHLRAGDARRLSSRVRERGSVLLVLLRRAQAWAEGPDLSLTVTAANWFGPDRGHGQLAARQIEVVVGGRRAAARPRRAVHWLPAPAALPGFAGAAFAGADLEAGVADPSMVDPPLAGTGTAG